MLNIKQKLIECFATLYIVGEEIGLKIESTTWSIYSQDIAQ